MEGLEKKYQAVLQTLSTLEDALNLIQESTSDRFYQALRDSLIQRFEYTIDTLWKYLKIYVQEVHKLDITVSSPRAILREALVSGIIYQKEYDQLMDCVTDRNLTSHSYNAELAEQLAQHIPRYYKIMRELSERIKP